jgi:3,4-dihydroxy 2-butanone 4-phosphate synthase/GTP cyclohydrolase II
MSAEIESAIADFQEGKMLILVDDEKRENEGDLIFAASAVTPEKINFLLKFGRGLVCIASPEERLRELDLKPLAMHNKSRFSTNFYDMIDATEGTTTGVSAYDQAHTIDLFTRPGTRPSDFARPGHVHTLGAREGGVLVRAGHTEGVVDLARLAGLPPYGVLCEIMNEDGSMSRLPELKEFAAHHHIRMISIKDLIEHRHRHEKLVKPIVTVEMGNDFGQWQVTYYESFNGEGHVALTMGDIQSAGKSENGVLVRVHSQCFTGDTLGSFRCDCGPQLHCAMKKVADEGVGVILYLHQEGRGIGLKNKLLAYKKQEEGMDTVEANKALGFDADLREYGIGAQILSDLGLHRIRLMTNNPRKLVGIGAFDLTVVDRVPLEVGHHEDNVAYLNTKKEKLGHLFGELHG